MITLTYYTVHHWDGGERTNMGKSFLNEEDAEKSKRHPTADHVTARTLKVYESFEESTKEYIEAKKMEVLSKLTDEEIAVLGL